MTLASFYLANEYWFAATQLALAMLGMGATLRVKDFMEVLLEPKAVCFGLAMQLLVTPLVALLFISFMPLSSELVIAIALIAAIPGGTTSNIFTYLARGNASLSIAVTAVTTVACLVTTPLVLAFLVGDYLPEDFVMPARQIASEIGMFLLAPLVLGMGILHIWPGSARQVAKWGIRISLGIIVLIVVGSSGAGRIDLAAYGHDNALLFTVFFGVLLLASAIFPRLVGLGRRDRVALEMEVVVRNVNLGLLISASLFPAVGAGADSPGRNLLISILLYGALQMVAAVPLIYLNGRKLKHRG